MVTARHLTLEELNVGLDNIRQSPKDSGVLEMIVRRPETEQREVLEEGELGPVEAVTRAAREMEGEMEVPGALVLLEFPDPEAAHAWHADLDLAHAHDLRRAGVNMSIFVTGAPA